MVIRTTGTLLLLLACGCSSLLPRSEENTGSAWTSYQEAQKAFDLIEPGVTTIADLRAMSLDPAKFVNTSDWANELAQQPAPKRSGRQSAAPANKPRMSGSHTPQPGEMESLEAMLEPERTGVHGKADKKTPWVLIIIVMLVLAAGAATAVVLMMT